MKTQHLAIIFSVFISLLTAISLFAQTTEPDANAIIAEIMRYADSTNTRNNISGDILGSTINTPAQSDKTSQTTSAVFTLSDWGNLGPTQVFIAWGDQDNDGELDGLTMAVGRNDVITIKE